MLKAKKLNNKNFQTLCMTKIRYNIQRQFAKFTDQKKKKTVKCN